MILALETATDVCSVALRNTAGEVFEKRSEERGSHSELLFLFIEALFEEQQAEIADLDGVLVSRGPGSYTGLRIGASAVKGLLFRLDVPLVSVNTLASFAAGIVQKNPDNNRIHAVIDARRVHLYHQVFRVESGGVIPGDEVEVLPIKTFEAMVKKGDIVVGTGLDRLDSGVRSKTRVFGPEAISAVSLFYYWDRADQSDLAEKVSPAQFEPRYYTSRQVK